jgi:CheY-like chemotaxis protein
MSLMHSQPSGRTPIILLAEDEEPDAIMFRMALEQSGLPYRLIALQDGHQIVSYLRGDLPYADRSRCPLPDLLVLDLHMPRMNGFDVLAWLAARRDFKRLPAVVLSSSREDSDVAKARQLGAADYRVKSHHIPDIVQILESLGSRWLSPRHGEYVHA